MLAGQEKEGHRLSEFSKTLQIPFSSTSGLLATLAEFSFLSLDSKTQKYSLGPEILSLAGSYLDSLDVVEQGRAVLSDVVAETGEFAGISMRTGMDVMLIAKEESREPVYAATIAIGERYPMYISASGKVILSFLPKEEVEEYFSSIKFKPFTPKTIIESDKLRKELDEVRSSWLAYNIEEARTQIAAMAAPIFNMYGEVIASMFVYIPVMRFDKEKEGHLKKVLKKYSILLSKKMGFKGSHPAHV